MSSGSEQSIASDVDDDDRENCLERIVENDGNREEAGADDGGGDNIENEEDKEKRVVKPKRIIKNPRPKLNVDTLRGPKGLSCLENYFRNVTFKGNGHEAQDLRTIMKTYEYWCHRLFPKYPFDECLAKIENIGSKNNVQTYLKRIRLDMDDFGTSKPQISDNDDDDDDDVEDKRPKETDYGRKLEDHGVEDEPLTEEQLEMIRVNRERAQQLRMKQLQKMQAKVNLLVPESNILERSTAAEPSNFESATVECE